MSEFEHEFEMQVDDLRPAFESGKRAKGTDYKNPYDPKMHRREYDLWVRGKEKDDNWEDIKQEVEESL